MKHLQSKLLKLYQQTHSKDTSGDANASGSDLRDLYKRLITEEYKELMDEPNGSDRAFKELCDLIWVCIQYANSSGFNLELGMNELIKEYESKFYTKEGKYEPLYREDGKLLKNTGFKKANFSKIIGRL